MSNQLIKKNHVEGYKNVFPKTFTDAIRDKESGVSLQEILRGFNMYFLSYNGNKSLTRCKVPSSIRKEGLWITYVLYDHTVVTEWYNSDNINDDSWGDDSNWRVGNNALVGDVTISSDGYWVINGEKTEAKAQGDRGITPLIRFGENNKFQISYTEGKTWKDLSNSFTSNVRISKYIGINESLPTSGIDEGTIYMKGPYYDENDTNNDNPIYRMWVYSWKGNTLAWQDNGEFTSISAGVVQDRGTSTTEIMSQDAVTRELTKLESEVGSNEIVNYNKSILINPGYIDLTGKLYPTSDNYGHSDFIPVLKGQIITTYVQQGTSVSGISFYDKNHSFIEGFSGEGYIYTKLEHEVKNNVRYVRFSHLLDNNSFSASLSKSGIFELIDLKEAAASSNLKTTILNEVILNSYVRADDGVLVQSGSNNTSVRYSVKGIVKLEVIGAWYDDIPAAVAFYDEYGNYLKDYTIRGVKSSTPIVLLADVPTNAEYAISSSAWNIAPIIKSSNIGEIVKRTNDIVQKNKENIDRTSSITLHSIVYPTSPCVDYHHLFIDKIYTNSKVTIPCQSLFDVHIAAKLGFKMIEANVLITSDGVPVTGHQVGSGILQTLTDLDGNNVEVHVPSLTFDELRTKYIYKSIFPQYRTRITSLEEFLLECKKFNLTPFVQCVNKNVIELTESIMGQKYVAYNATRSDTKAVIYDYKGGTIDEIIKRCKSTGAPYICGLTTTVLQSLTDAEIKEVVSKVHEVGCWLGWAGAYHSVAETLRFRRLGLDFSGSGWDVPDFEMGDEANLYGNSVKGFSDFSGDFVENNGIAKLKVGNHLSKVLPQKSIIAKGSIHLQFDGKIGITFGKINDIVTSDGKSEVVLTSIIENTEPNLYIYAYEDIDIYNISYKVSNVL